MQFLGTDILPYFENLTTAMLEKENMKKLVELLNKVDNSDRSKAFSRIKNLVEISNELANGVAKGNTKCQGINCLTNGGANDNWVNLNLDGFQDLVEAGKDLEDDWAEYDDRVSVIQFLFEAIQDSIARPTSCANVGEQCKVYKKLEGGVNATETSLPTIKQMPTLKQIMISPKR